MSTVTITLDERTAILAALFLNAVTLPYTERTDEVMEALNDLREELNDAYTVSGLRVGDEQFAEWVATGGTLNFEVREEV